MDRIGIGVISLAHGHVGTYCEAMKGFEDVDLVAVWDDNESRGRQAPHHDTKMPFRCA